MDSADNMPGGFAGSETSSNYDQNEDPVLDNGENNPDVSYDVSETNSTTNKNENDEDNESNDEITVIPDIETRDSGASDTDIPAQHHQQAENEAKVEKNANLEPSDGRPPVPSRQILRNLASVDPEILAQASIGATENTLEPEYVVTDDLLQSKLNQLNAGFNNKSSQVQTLIRSATQNIRKTFNDIRTTVGALEHDYQIDWEFWANVVNDYESVVQNNSHALHSKIAAGIPKEVRGIVWQLVAQSKNYELEEFYLTLKSETSIHEKAIKRDLTRTSFYTAVDAVSKGEDLYNVIKAYSLFDPDVGYTQGMIFVAVPLIMNMTDSECFCLLVTMMKDYRLRDLFCPDMRGLHRQLYQFDRLLEQNSPLLYNHLVKQGIKSSMYASQWFLTFFAYKFPLEIVLRIYDIVITHGIEALLKFAVNLMLQNENKLLSLKFDKLLEFLKDHLFNRYVNDEFVDERRFSLRKRQGSSSSYYNLDSMVEDAMAIKVSMVDLAQFEREFDAIYASEKHRAEEIDELRHENGRLRHDIKALEHQFSVLNRDHVDIVQKMVDTKVMIPEIESENDDLQKAITQLRADLEELEAKMKAPSVSSSESTLDALKSPAIPQNIEEEIQRLLQVNAQEIEKCTELEEQLETLTVQDEELLEKLGKKRWWQR
ncbi:hypothetical protein QFC19_002104 [Naganishia cerealis]|uniref:Uncharacterized protein n=1 Tax=Naganishia cerealis TaxID=610337 RepID=A0ACC2WDV8_9TREE|nr:hypothetical protein QFC19_002104 [Naganishia cerealis]